MASIALEKLEGHLNCSICLDIYQNPKQLQCHHVYCQQCLVKLVLKDQQGQLSLPCPICREATPVPANGVAGLQAAFQVNQLLEIVEQHKQVKDSSVNEENTSEAVSSQPEKVSVHCPEHNERGIDLYCKTCEEAICFKCIMKDEKHHSHQYEEIDKAFQSYKVELTDLLVPLEKQLTVIEKSLEQLDSRKDEVANQERALEEDIKKAISQLHVSLDVRRKELVDQLHSLSQDKLKKLAVQKDQIETIQAQLSSCLHFLVENLEMSNHAEALMMRRGTVEQVNELTATFQADILKPGIEANMAILAMKNLDVEFQSYGEVVMIGPPDPFKCVVKQQDCSFEKAKVGVLSSAVIEIFDSDDHPCNVQEDAVTCELVSERRGTRIRGNVRGRGGNHYEMDFEPTIQGRHQLRIKLEGQHIIGSPYSIFVDSSIENLGSPISTFCNVNGITYGVAVKLDGNVFLTGWDNHSVTVLSSTGEELRSFGSYLHSPLGVGFRNPHGIAVDGVGNVFIADCSLLRIQKFTSHGIFLAQGHTGYFQSPHPRGIALNPLNNLIYVSCTNGSIEVFFPNLDYFFKFGKKGSDLGQLNNPRHLTCDKAGRVYVADSGNHRVQVFTADGTFLRMLGRGVCGREKGELNEPFGVALDSHNRVYVSEKMNHRISVFNPMGEFVALFGVKGEGPGEFCEPAGLAFDSDGILYVCDSGNNRIQLY